CLGRPSLHGVERGPADEQRARPDDVRHLELRRNGDDDTVEVAERANEVALILGGDDERRGRLPPVREQLCRAVRGRRVERLGAEDRLVERDVLLLRAQHGCLGSGHVISLISTMPFFGPGTAPLTSSRLRSASTEWIERPTCVTRLPPIWPAIFLPLNTRDGV